MSSKDNFKALLLSREESTPISADIVELTPDDLPQEGDVLVEVAYSGLNYKDGLVLAGKGGLVRNYPHIGGIDFAGRVVESADSNFKAGDEVVLTGWRVGEAWWGGYAQMARVKSDWLLPLPQGFSCATAMAIGTAGVTAMLGILALEEHGITPDSGTILVTGATGGVGSVAAMLLVRRGYQVAAVSGKADAEKYLARFGVDEVIPRAELAEAIDRPMESARWAGVIDSVGGAMLARVLGQVNYGGSVAAIGNAGGVMVPASIIPFLLRGVNLLGIDSVMQPIPRRQLVWEELAKTLDFAALDAITEVIALENLPEYGASILKGGVSGRVVVGLA